MLTVGIYYTPTGGKAWIEDVVLDTTYRGKGLSKILVRHAIDFVKSQGIPCTDADFQPQTNSRQQAVSVNRI